MGIFEYQFFKKERIENRKLIFSIYRIVKTVFEHLLLFGIAGPSRHDSMAVHVIDAFTVVAVPVLFTVVEPNQYDGEAVRVHQFLYILFIRIDVASA